MRKIFVLLFCLLSVKLFATDCRTTYGISPSIIATASCDINVNDKTIGGNATGGAITFTLDNCASSTKDVTHFFWKTDSSGNAVTLDGYSAQTVNGSATFSLPTQYTAARLRCQGNGNWIIESGSLSVIGSGSIGTGSITPGADDTMLISNGSAFQNKTIPACTDTGGNHLNYDQATNSLSCGTSGGSATITNASTATSGFTSGYLLKDNGGTIGEVDPSTLGGGLTVGTTTVGSGTDTYILYNNAGTLGNEQSVPVANGGTGATTATAARGNLGVITRIAGDTGVANFNPADSTTYLLSPNDASGHGTGADVASSVAYKMFVPAGTVVQACVAVSIAGTLGSAETATATVNKNSVATSMTWSVSFTTGNVTRFCTTSNTFTVANNDYIAVTVAMPAFATNPTNVRMSYWVDVREDQ